MKVKHFEYLELKCGFLPGFIKERNVSVRGKTVSFQTIGVVTQVYDIRIQPIYVGISHFT